MAGKTLINGTAYDISGGKTLVDGTAYSIAGGKTLVSGTSYDISFGVDLAELFSGMTVLRTDGRNSGSTGRITIESVSTYLNTGETGYIFSFFNGYMSIAKIVCGTSGTQAIYQSSESYGNCWYALSSDAIWYHDTMNSGYNSKYGATLALVQFNQPEAKVDAALSALQYVSSSGANSANLSGIAVYISPTSFSAGDYVFVSVANGFSINLVNASGEPVNIFCKKPSAYSVSNNSFLRLYASSYYLAYSNNSYDKVNGGTIHAVRGG